MKNFNQLKNDTISFYKNIGEIYSPYFQEKINFNSKGLEHLSFKSKNHSRPVETQKVRFKLLKLAPELIKISRTIQGISKQKLFEINRSNQRNELILVDVIFYEFIAIIKDIRIRVIIKQIENGPKFFWSVIPFWKVNKKINLRRMYYGNPEFD